MIRVFVLGLTLMLSGCGGSASGPEAVDSAGGPTKLVSQAGETSQSGGDGGASSATGGASGDSPGGFSSSVAGAYAGVAGSNGAASSGGSLAGGGSVGSNAGNSASGGDSGTAEAGSAGSDATAFDGTLQIKWGFGSGTCVASMTTTFKITSTGQDGVVDFQDAHSFGCGAVDESGVSETQTETLSIHTLPGDLVSIAAMYSDPHSATAGYSWANVDQLTLIASAPTTVLFTLQPMPVGSQTANAVVTQL